VTAPRHEDIDQGEVLWIKPEQCCLPELPRGFALRVDEFLGWDYDTPVPHQVWVRGAVLRHEGGTLRSLVVRVPVDQPRAVRQPPAARPEPAGATGTSSSDGNARCGGARVVEHAGRLYRRVEFPDG
jgi:hypothetical protein